MIYLIYLVITIMILLIWSKPYYASLFLCLVISMSPFLDLYISSTKYYAINLLIVFVLMLCVFRDHLIFLKIPLLILTVVIFVLFQVLLISITSMQFELSLLRYIAIPVVSYYTIIYLKKNNLKLSDVFIFYIIINLIICYYRALIDYSFFGSIFTKAGTIYESQYSVGGVLYRPSNLNSPIIFSIELVAYWSLYLYEKGKTKMFYLISLVSIYPFILMRSRSAFVLLGLCIGSHLIYKKKYVLLSVIGFLSIIMVVLFSSQIHFLSVFNFHEESYATRVNSIIDTILNFRNESWQVVLFGKGFGTANMILVPGSNMAVYVENFHLSLLYDAGLVVFGTWIIFNIKIILSAIKKHKYAHIAVIIIGILFINIFSTNLTSYTVQVLYWQLAFMLLVNQKNTYNSACEKSNIVSDCTINEEAQLE